MSQNEAEANWTRFNEVYGSLKKILKRSSDEEIEGYIDTCKKEHFVDDEQKLRQLFYDIKYSD